MANTHPCDGQTKCSTVCPISRVQQFSRHATAKARASSAEPTYTMHNSQFKDPIIRIGHVRCVRLRRTLVHIKMACIFADGARDTRHAYASGTCVPQCVRRRARTEELISRENMIINWLLLHRRHRQRQR